MRQRGSISSRLANPLQRSETQNTTASRLRSNSPLLVDREDDNTIEHPVEPRATTAMLPPVMVCLHMCTISCLGCANISQSKVIDPDPLCWLEFTQDSIITSCKSGQFPKGSIIQEFKLTSHRSYSYLGSTSGWNE